MLAELGASSIEQLFDEIPQQYPKRLAPFVFRQHTGNVARNRIGASGSHFAVDSGQLILGQTDGDLRPGQTEIIPRETGISSRAPWQASLRPDFEPRANKRSQRGESFLGVRHLRSETTRNPGRLAVASRLAGSNPAGPTWSGWATVLPKRHFVLSPELRECVAEPDPAITCCRRSVAFVP